MVPLWPGVSAVIPTGVALQFRFTGIGPLQLVLMCLGSS